MNFSIKSWQAFAIGLILVEGNAFIKSLWIPEFPFAEVNTFLVWLLGFYLVKRVAQKSPKLGGNNAINTKTP